MTESQLSVQIRSMIDGLRACREQDFIRFHALFYNRIFAYNMVLSKGDEQISVSLTHETLLKFSMNAKILKTENEIFNYLRRISRNLYIDWLRKEARRPELAGLPVDEVSSMLEEEYLAAKEEILQKLEGEIERLPDKERIMLKKYYFEGESQLELAEKFELSRKAVESKISRIRRFLKKKLIGGEDER